MNGAKLLLKCLKNQGVDIIFGYPGGAVIPLYDALYEDNRFKHIRTAHEQGAIHAADGYARSSGKVGVCFATSGPGATNIITGIATAYMDSVPLVVITGQVPLSLLGKDSFQEIDITGISMSITKHNYLVRSVEELQEIVEKAFYVAKCGRPGPVLIDIPKDIFLSEVSYKEKIINEKIYKEKNVDIQVIDKIVDMINKSQRPVIYAGGGVISANACKELVAFSKKGDIPVVNTLMGLGSINREDELSLGLVGMHGLRESNLAVINSDLVIGIGARFSDRVIGNSNGFAPNAQIIHIDIDATEMNKNMNSNIHILGNLKNILSILTEKIKNKHNEYWKQHINSLKHKGKNLNDIFNPKNILMQFNKKFSNETFVVTDVGQHQMWTAQYWKFKYPRTFITSGGLGTMGFGLGAAIGVQLANIDKNVLLVTGDGSFRMNCNELLTVSKYKIPITILMLNNKSLGMVRQWQKLFCDERYSQTEIDDELNHSTLASAYKIKGYKAESMNELNHLLDTLEFGKEPIFIECIIDKDEGVYPIVPPGKSIDNLIEGEN